MKKMCFSNKILRSSTLLSLLFVLSVSDIYPGLFGSYGKKPPEENVQDLAIEQINSPNDPYINYNLGVALYKIGKFEAAKNNFERAVISSKNNKLKERSYFNLANSCYKNALFQLPQNWEDKKTEVEQEKLAKAVNETRDSIKNYESIIALSQDNEPAKVNLKKSKELLEKLNKKQKEQQQNKQDQKKQDEKQDDNKNQDQQQDQQGNQNQQDKKDQNGQSQEKQENKDENAQHDQQKQQDKSEQNKQEQSNQDQRNQGQDRQQEQQDKKDESLEQEQKQNQSKSGEQKQQDSQASQQAQAQQRLGEIAQRESAEEKAKRLMLEDLQRDEEGLQKTLIQRQTKDQKPLQSGQKPW
jgi:hypothetical protein